MNARSVRVDLGERSYTVHIGPGALLSVPDEIRRSLGERPTRAFVVHDAGVPQVYCDELCAALRGAGLDPTVRDITPTEHAKSMDTLTGVLRDLGASGHSRADPVVALGGGITGDLAGFAAACYQRGVPVVQCPSTLLSMVDASVGGKTGVNLLVPAPGGERLLKNMVGAFHQPLAVAADTRLLDSLDDRQRRSGMAECVKHAMIAYGVTGADLLSETRAVLPAVLAGERDATDRLIERSVALKGEVVRRDERESLGGAGGAGGMRMLLNLGHTFGHAIETIPHLTPDPAFPEMAPLLHGEAVALGMVAACRCAEAAGKCDASLGDELVGLLDTIGLPTRVAGLPEDDEIIARMGSDKKAAGGVGRLVLPVGRGRCEVTVSPDGSWIRAGLKAIRG
ncbi:MAG: 3-dehydroquinate synthase [Phycisphaerales bacterium]|nr:3-dehydroquinate synthase [Planctomycetota bacterium]MCH8507432.1 3-dehydroquinate synthase [Phycisphaerales bacterium]